MKDFNSSYVGIRKDLLTHIAGSGHKILDIGCANGANGKYLLDHNIASKIIGIEFDHKMALEAAQIYEKVVVGDLNQPEFRTEILGMNERFDYIIMGDILEHLVEPQEFIKKLSLLIKTDGKLIISVPNIKHIELFIQVYLNGTWPRNTRGIFDSTHVSWFTKSDIYSIVEKSGLFVEKYAPNIRARDAINSKFTFPLRILKKFNKDWFVFQHVLVCVKK